MRAIMRCDASPRIGVGHLSRCLTLARGLVAQGFTLGIATRAPSEHTRRWIATEGHDLLVLEEEDEVAATERAARGASLVVIDGYDFGPSLPETLRRDHRVICVVDDLATEPVRADVVLNGNLYALELSYDVPRDTVLLCGPSFALVREEFVHARVSREARRPREDASRLLVTMGGADPTRETEKAFAALDALARQVRLDVKVAVGAANPRVEEIRRLAAAQRTHGVEVLTDVRAMGELMVWCDVALTAAGSTSLELACVGVPASVVVVADNQRGIGAALSARALMDVVDREPRVVAASIANLLANRPRRLAMEASQRRCIDGHGKDRAASRLSALVMNRPTSRLDSR